MDPHTRNHNFRDHVKCRTKSLLQSAVSAAVAVALTIPFISKLPLTDVARRSVEVNNVAELEAKDGEGPIPPPASNTLVLPIAIPRSHPARVAKLVDARDLKSFGFGRAGSSPAPGTTVKSMLYL